MTIAIDSATWWWIGAVVALIIVGAFVCGMAYGIMREHEAEYERRARARVAFSNEVLAVLRRAMVAGVEGAAEAYRKYRAEGS